MAKDRKSAEKPTYDVCIDAGHGATYFKEDGKTKVTDYGANYEGFNERDFGRKMEAEIRRISAPYEKYGLKFHYTSDKIDGKVFENKKESLAIRYQLAKNVGAEEFISMHFDSRGGNNKGMRTHYYDAGDMSLAQSVSRALSRAHQSVTNKGLHQDNFAVIKGCGKINGVLIEFGDSNEDALRTPKLRENVARSIVLSSVERAVAAGVPIPSEKVAALKQQCTEAMTCSLGKVEPSNALIAEHKQKPAKIVPEAGHVAHVSAEKPTLSRQEMQKLVQKAFPKLEGLTVDDKGNIYTKDSKGAAIATFTDNDTLFIKKELQKTLSGGKASIDIKDIKHTDVKLASLENAIQSLQLQNVDAAKSSSPLALSKPQARSVMQPA